MDQENPSALESNNQILAAPLHGGDALAFQLGCDFKGLERPDEPRIEDLDVLEASPDEHGLEPPADGLDFG